MRLIPKPTIKAKATQILEANGEYIVDSAAIGDYEFFITKNRFITDIPPQIGMQRRGQSMASIKEQLGKTPQEMGKFSMVEVKKLLDKWLDTYGSLIAASHNKRKTEVYNRILTSLGFKISKRVIMGYPAPIVSK